MAEPELSLKALRVAALPEFDPPAHLWARIEAEHHRRRQRRRGLQWGIGIAAALALATVLLVAPQRDVTSSSTSTLALLESRSQELEQRYAGLSQAATALENEAELRAVELALQRAYDRGAAAEELMPLWQQRNDVLASLIALAADGAQLTRI
jgi:hypothetical protein